MIVENQAKNKKVFVGMSGGVDSSVTALLLKQATPKNFKKIFGYPAPKGFGGFDVTGVFIKSYNVDGCAERDAEDARRVAEQIGIPFYVFDFEKEYKKKVVEYMIDGYRKGLTPNPDVMCNREIKFGLFLKRALSLGADFVATGHYVAKSVSKVAGGKSILKIAKDKNKDQSYFLWTLTQNELKHCLFPLGNLTKPEVRAIAKEAGLVTAEKKDSQGVCFLGMVDMKDFLRRFIKTKKGNVVSATGEIVGAHDGAQLYTIGQRHGFRLHSGAKRGAHETLPHYVIAKDVKRNTITIAEGEKNPLLFKKNIELVDVNFVLPVKHKEVFMVRVRYRQPLSPAILEISGSRVNPRYKLTFKKPQKFVAEGQSAVFYKKGGGLAGGGIIVYNS